MYCVLLTFFLFRLISAQSLEKPGGQVQRFFLWKGRKVKGPWRRGRAETELKPGDRYDGLRF